LGVDLHRSAAGPDGRPVQPASGCCGQCRPGLCGVADAPGGQIHHRSSRPHLARRHLLLRFDSRGAGYLTHRRAHAVQAAQDPRGLRFYVPQTNETLSSAACHNSLTNETRREGTAMSSTEDKMKGKANESIGKVKQGLGEATDNPRLKGEGQAQEVKG